jgi:hypothetical protein
MRATTASARFATPGFARLLTVRERSERLILRGQMINPAMPTPLLAIHLHKDYVTEIELSAETTWPAARERA